MTGDFCSSKFFASVVAVAALWPATPTGAQIPTDLRGARVVEVAIAGETEGITSPREVGIPLGSRVSRRLLRNAIRRLMASARWRDVKLDLIDRPGGVKVLAHLVPRVVLLRVEVRGNEIVEDEELLRNLGTGPGSELRTEDLDALAQRTLRLYADRGYPNASAEMIVRDTDDPARKVLRIRIEEGAPTLIAKIVFDGETPPRESQALDSLGFGTGDVLDRPQLEQAVRSAEETMRSRGWLRARLRTPEYTVAENGEAIVTIPTRVDLRYRLVIEGHRPIPRTEVEAALNLGDERLTNSVMRNFEERVVDLYQRYGFYDVEVDVERQPTDREGQGELTISIRSGTPLRVIAVTFPGARHFDVSFLRNQVFSYLQEDLPGSSFLYPVDTETVDSIGYGSTTERRREVPKPLAADPETVFYEPTYVEAITHIQQLYEADGYLQAQLGPARLSRLDNGTGIVEVPVLEGAQSLLYEVRVRGNQVFGDRAVSEIAALERGEPFSHLALEDAKKRVVERYRSEGYYYVRVEPSVVFSSDRTLAQVTFEIVESFQVRVGRILVEGNDLTEASLILARLAFVPGDILRPEAFQESQESLATLGIFSGVNIAPEDADLPARIKPVVITVTERKPQYIDFGLGFSTGEGLRGHVEYGYRNAFGIGHEFIFRADTAFQVLFLGDPQLQERFEALSNEDRLERTLSVQWRIPHFLARTLEADINAAILRNNERDFGLESFSSQGRLGWSPTQEFTGELGLGIEQNSVDLFVGDSIRDFLRTNTDPRLERLLRVPEGSTTIVAADIGASFDLRDSPFTPTEGFLAATTAEYIVSLTSESQAETEPFVSNFIKVAATTGGYIPIAEDVVFATQLRFGRIFHLTSDSNTYPNRAFYLGGVDTLRGYLQDALIPQDVADQVSIDPDLGPNDIARAGDAFVLLRSELRFPIVGVFHGGVFLDVGNIWADAGLILDTFSLRPTAGLGLRIETPVGPLAFDYGVILLRRPRPRRAVRHLPLLHRSILGLHRLPPPLSGQPGHSRSAEIGEARVHFFTPRIGASAPSFS